MAEWVVLLVLVPAIVIPVVLLFGFAGCLSKPHFEPPPMITSAAGGSLSSVVVAWFAGGAASRFKIDVRAHPNNTPVPPVHETTASPFEVSGLAPGLYRFRVRTVFTDGDESDWSTPVDAAPLTIGFTTMNEPGIPGDQPAQGFCVVQRIEPARLTTSGGHVRIILGGPMAGAASIDRVYMSRPASTGDPYDSPGDPTRVFDIDSTNPPGPPLVVQSLAEVPLPVVEFALDEAQPLLIAFDFTPTFPTTIRFLPVTTDALAFFQPGAAEAGIPGGNRTAGYSSANGVCLITRIEVG